MNKTSKPTMAARGRPFAKGVSGNPAGRPRKTPVADPTFETGGFSTLIVENAAKPTTIVENGEPRRVTQAEAVRQRQFIDAARGGARQQQDYLNGVRQAAERLKKDRDQEREELVAYERVLREQRLAYEERDQFEERQPKGPYWDPREIIVDLRMGRVLQNGPLGDFEKAQWDASREQARLLREDAERQLEGLEEERNPQYREIGRREAQEQLAIAADIESIFPDEATRRTPGFDLGEVRLKYFNRPDVLARCRKIESAKRAA